MIDERKTAERILNALYEARKVRLVGGEVSFCDVMPVEKALAAIESALRADLHDAYSQGERAAVAAERARCIGIVRQFDQNCMIDIGGGRTARVADLHAPTLLAALAAAPEGEAKP